MIACKRLSVLTCSLAALCISNVSSGSALAAERYVTSKTPYTPQQVWQEYAAVPAGYRAVMLQHVARHGSRGLSSPDDDDLILQLWRQAEQENALTELGKKLGPAAEALYQWHQSNGYGLISPLGIQEHEHMAERIVQRLPALFDASNDEIDIRVTHSGRTRAAQSGDAFIAGLRAALPSVENLRIAEPQASIETLYFHQAEGSEGFDAYRRSDPQLMAAMNTIEQDPRTLQVVEDVLLRLFTAEFVERLESGEYHFVAADDESDTLSDGMDALDALFGLYSIVINLEEDLVVDMTPFVTDEHAAWLAFIDDADSFYGRGPGFAGRDITYRAADALFIDMVEQIELLNTAPESAPQLSVRFTHAQATMPAATWLDLPTTEQRATEDNPYNYETFDWRAATVSPMSANIQWEVYQNNAGQILVRMLHNEAQVTFHESCRPLQNTTYFYRFEELKRCLGERHQLSW